MTAGDRGAIENPSGWRTFRLGISGRLVTAFAVISLLGIAASLVAAVSFQRVQGKFDEIANVQLQTFETAAELIRQAEELAGVAPNLYASRAGSSALLAFSITSYALKSNLQDLIGDLEATTGQSAHVATIRDSADGLFANLDRLATALFDRASNEQALQRAIPAAADMLRAALADEGADAATLLPLGALLLDVTSASTAERVDELSAAIEAALASDELPEAGKADLRAQIFGPAGIVTLSRRQVEILTLLSELLSESETQSGRLAADVGQLTQSLTDDIRAQNADLAADTQSKTLLLRLTGAVTLIAALLAAWYLQASVIRRLRSLRVAMQADGASSDLAHLARGNDEISDLSQTFAFLMEEIAERDRVLRKSQNRLENAIESISEGFALFDASDELIVANARYKTIMAIAEGHGQDPAPSIRAIFAHAARAGRFRNAVDAPEDWVERQMERHRTGAPAFVQELSNGGWVRVSERRTDEGGTVAIYADVTELKRVSEELRQAKDDAERANEAKSAFLATMSHELRTPLNGIIGTTQILEHTPLDEDQRDLTATMSEAAETLLSIISDILDFSKIESGAMEMESAPFNLVHLVEGIPDLVGSRAFGKGIEVICTIAPDVPADVEGDQLRLRQVLLNLMNNAIKFTEKGEIELAVRRDAGAPGRLAMSVRDTGIGIPADRMSRLFQSFSQVDASTTRKYGGTGLGLAICKRLVELMGGEITVDSAPGRGTTFAFAWPVTEGRGEARGRDRAFAGKSALVLDANPRAAESLGERLAEWGMICATANDLAQARRLVAASAFDVVFADATLPGFDPKAGPAGLTPDPSRPSVPLVVLTPPVPGLSDLRSHAARHGIAAVLAKPPKLAPLRRCLEALFSGAGAPAVPASTPTPAADMRLPKLSVLLVDDHRMNRKVGSRILQSLGLEPDVRASGPEAIEACRQRRYDLVFMDIEMPDMDGTEACRRILSETPATGRPWIVALTANALSSDREKYLVAGFDDYLSKPIDIDLLVACLRRVGKRDQKGEDGDA